MVTIRVMYWKEIPVQVEFQSEKLKKVIQLDDRFQAAVDSVAMKDGSFGTDDYLDGWQWQFKEEIKSDLTEDLISKWVAKYDNYPADLIKKISMTIDNGTRSTSPGSIDHWIFR
ncbi:MAG: virulence factor [Chloroflexota bacterium]|tara:strand:+ start:950 stop:1291 length:342 start_codon:yes stop_codon:yes gene_type:complete